MRAVVMRVKHASVTIDGRVNGAIGQGLLILLGVAPTDTPALCDKLAEKALGLRIFCDENGKMNRSLADVGGQVLVVSQFNPKPVLLLFLASAGRNGRFFCA